NDFSGPIAESDFVTAYVGLLSTVRGYYPAAHIFCVSWESWGATAQGYIATAIAAFGDAAVSEVPFVVDANDGWGCDYHPGQTMQAKLGAELASAIQATMGW
ncbi:MAG: hypothetical protein IT373_10330, partial [Polyangiaceae bacterium]|nr:hypothetical protein [Polyangiaceae bacterium]